MANRSDTVLFSNKNRRMAFRVQLEDNAFSLFCENTLYSCLSISNQGCLIKGPIGFTADIINAEMWHETIKIGGIKGKMIRSSDDGTVALHFIAIGRETKAIIEEYILSLQKKELRIASTEKRKLEEERVLRE
jgi:hypothetical protein